MLSDRARTFFNTSLVLCCSVSFNVSGGICVALFELLLWEGYTKEFYWLADVNCYCG
jgi:hypothetical protein